jgi:N-acetylmuramoyl-L-alanine amidase
MRIAMSSGHGQYIRGASGSPVPPQLDEVDEARRVVERVADKLRLAGVECVTFHDNTSRDQSTNLATIVDWHNSQDRELDVSQHFNAFDGSAHGVEVLYVSQKTLAGHVAAAIAEAGDFTNRGAKYRSDLYFLNNTEMPAVLIETCFCDNTSDSAKYTEAFDDICEAMAESLTGREIPDVPPPEVEQPPGEVTGDNRVEISAQAEGDVTVMLNGTRVYGHEGCEHVVEFTLQTEGDVTVVINGEEFHNRE